METVRSALCRQPASPATRDLAWVMPEGPANGGVFRIGYRSPNSEIDRCGTEIADSLRRCAVMECKKLIRRVFNEISGPAPNSLICEIFSP